MSWLRRILGGDGREPGDREPAGARDLGYETNPRAAATAKAELLRVLRERGARAALITYDGGHDEGSVSEIVVSAEPLGAPPEEWRGATLAAGDRIDMDRAWDVWGSEDLGDDDRRLSELLDAADTFIAAKWEGFAGEFEVQGRVVVDVDGERIARHDVVTVDEEYGKQIPTRWIAEQHIVEDLGFLPSLSQWLSAIVAEPWMMRSRPLSRMLDREEARP